MRAPSNVISLDKARRARKQRVNRELKQKKKDVATFEMRREIAKHMLAAFEIADRHTIDPDSVIDIFYSVLEVMTEESDV